MSSSSMSVPPARDAQLEEKSSSFQASAGAGGRRASKKKNLHVPSTLREKENWAIHQLYVRHDFVNCLKLIEEQLILCKGQSEYPLYVKGLILRQQGKIKESLELFQAATVINPQNLANLKQVGRSLYLLGKYRQALTLYDAALAKEEHDWEIWHNKGLCHMFLKNYPKALECFQTANAHQRHDATFVQLAKVLTLQERYKEAIDVLVEALEFSPENTEILTTLGLLHLRQGETFKASDYLGNSLTYDVKNPKTILAFGSIVQDHDDMKHALLRYRVAAVVTPNSAQLWNNIGMCFFGEKNYVAAIASLKRARYLDPFEWIIAYNLGLVHLNTGQYASAFHYLSSSINMKADFPLSYMYLAMTLSLLKDYGNACQAYQKAIEMDSDHIFHLNFAITLYKCKRIDEAKEQFAEFNRMWDDLDEESQNSDPDIKAKKTQLSKLLYNG